MNDVTGKGEAITAQAIVIAAAHRYEEEVPSELLANADPAPLALYIAVKYLQSLPQDDELRIWEHGMKAVLVGRYGHFVEQALSSDRSPPELSLFEGERQFEKPATSGSYIFQR
jgi:hypothetical protein